MNDVSLENQEGHLSIEKLSNKCLVKKKTQKTNKQINVRKSRAIDIFRVTVS